MQSAGKAYPKDSLSGGADCRGNVLVMGKGAETGNAGCRIGRNQNDFLWIRKHRHHRTGTASAGVCPSQRGACQTRWIAWTVPATPWPQSGEPSSFLLSVSGELSPDTPRWNHSNRNPLGGLALIPKKELCEKHSSFYPYLPFSTEGDTGSIRLDYSASGSIRA